MPAQSSYKLILPKETHQTYVNLMAQYHLSHAFADRMREHFVATLSEFIGGMKVSPSGTGGLKVNIQPPNSVDNGTEQKKDSFVDSTQPKKAEQGGIVIPKMTPMRIPDEEAEEQGE